MKRIVILGSTGSIGKASVEIILRSAVEFEVVGLSANSDIDELERQLSLFPKAKYALGSIDASLKLATRDAGLERRSFGTGREGVERLIEETGPDLVINALVGIAGLPPTIKALETGCTLALANKESLVTAGGLVMKLVSEDPERLLPVDSEHFSLGRCLRGYRDDTAEIILTASGGPFRGRERSGLSNVTVEEVLDHPTWRMGRKVTVDSANLFNKGLEVIEAHRLYNYSYKNIKVIIHPQSIVHSIIRLNDGSLLAHLAPPDMRLPIQSALRYPEIVEFEWRKLGLEDLGSLDFFPFDQSRYPAFELAVGAGITGGTAPAVVNAADEVAVESFLSGRIGFLTIVDWIDEALSAHRPGKADRLEDVLDADRWTREFLAGRHREAAPA